ncbi:uncharacterized protein OCT59_013929 [Rhizophagus irregularis]|uniref:uncharacterized protein n=1 Tax=Rhizophagus irregularis TaxID=588596 RepID=UPI001C13E8C3|nr:hypothetical protein OCT59_013929 [Rhizophagus irregularis]CAB5181688.1 unnamed protein product [Rhizophagus irregularis]
MVIVSMNKQTSMKSTLDKNFIQIIYLPWWDTSIYYLTCNELLKLKSDSQKWCSYCFIIYTGCRYCLTTNITFGITNQSKCRKCKRVIDIDVTGIEYNLEKFISRIFINNNIVNWEQGSNVVDLVLYQFMQKLEYHDFNPIKANGQI